jgi:hypothetical protein
MSNTETQPGDMSQWPDRPLTDAQIRNRDAAALIPVQRAGAAPMDFAQMVDYAKFMSTARGAVGQHLMNNVGACLAIMEIAKQFDMPAYAVARQSYFVNGRIAFMGQFVHALINKYCPLKEKLKWRYEGEWDRAKDPDQKAATLRIIVTGTFKDETEPREWESPMLKEIVVKNSPLWKTNPKHQLVYFGVRAWQTVNWPEGMLEVQTDDEAAMFPEIGADRARDITPGAELRDRLLHHQGSQPEGHKAEGFQHDFVESELAEQHDQTDQQSVDATDAPPPNEETIESGIEAATAEPPVDPDKKPTTAAEWVPYALAWIKAGNDPDALRKKWSAEQRLRNKVGVTSEERDPVFEAYQNRLIELEGE